MPLSGQGRGIGGREGGLEDSAALESWLSSSLSARVVWSELVVWEFWLDSAMT